MNKTKPEPSRDSTKIRKKPEVKSFPMPTVVAEKQTRQSVFAVQHGYFESRMFKV